MFPTFPFGTDFTDDELEIIKILKKIKNDSTTFKGKMRLIKSMIKPKKTNGHQLKLLQRLELDSPKSFKESMLQRLINNTF